MRIVTVLLLLPLVLHPCSTVHADTFGNGSNIFEIPFVTIGDPGNPADNTFIIPMGAVSYEYRISKYEISEEAINKANAQSALEGNPLGITHDGRGDSKPATSISWFEAAKYVNWLNTSSGSSPAYKFDPLGNFQEWQPEDIGYNPHNVLRNRFATYVLPSLDEWFKAAAYEPGSDGNYFLFSTGSDIPPAAVASGTMANTAVFDGQLGPADTTLAGGLSAFGTMGQGGNVREGVEVTSELAIAGFAIRGGNYSSRSMYGITPYRRFRIRFESEFSGTGFRVASIPEPTTCTLALAALCMTMRRRHV